ncbi:MAG: 2Fe-2S iron-sulfur cluster-binding protein [Gammaproteobacteria bacterium]|nr:2Fe-2S iron-sulfur cluster-binding protein [Gammaproteobacteria bacterium]
MTDLLTLSRAARLVGITRGELQQRIRRDELDTFEGKVRVSDLLRAFPEARLEDDSTLERVNRIKSAATPEKEPKYELPSAEVLAQRVNILSHELTAARAELAGYGELVESLTGRLADLEQAMGEEQGGRVRELFRWLEEQVAARPREPRRNAALLAKDTFLRMLAAQVEVIPSGHDFFVEGNVSILDAGLRSGLALKYGCTSGSCGSCKARVVTGRVLKVRDHEYELSEREREMGYVLMCSYTAVTDVMIEADEAKGEEDISPQSIDTAVRRLDRPREDLVVLHLRTPATQRLRFLSGQSATLELPSEARGRLPLACCPCDSQNLEFHVHRGSASALARELFDHDLEPGARVVVTGPEGDALEDRGETSPMLFIIHEKGFSALKGFIENAISADDAERFHLIWITSDPEGRYMDNLCRAWSDALENFAYEPVVMAAPLDGGESRQAMDEALGRVEDIDTCEVYVAGAEEFTGAVTPLLQARGVAAERLQLRRQGGDAGADV